MPTRAQGSFRSPHYVPPHPNRWLPCWVGVLVLCQFVATVAGASPWPGGSETAITITGAGNDLSGATWNPESQSLWVVRQNRQVWEYAYDSGSASFALQQTLVLPSGIGSDIEAWLFECHDGSSAAIYQTRR